MTSKEKYLLATVLGDDLETIASRMEHFGPKDGEPMIELILPVLRALREYKLKLKPAKEKPLLNPKTIVLDPSPF